MRARRSVLPPRRLTVAETEGYSAATINGGWFSSYEGIRDWMTANVQQTDTVQQFLAYEKCYKITGGYNNCVAAHEPLSYTDKYPLTKNSWVALNGGRMAEIALAPGEKSRKP